MISRIFVQRIDWRGITVEISYEPEWLGGLAEAFGEPLAHLQVRSVSPERAALPVTETGYKSAFIAGSVITLEGDRRVNACKLTLSLAVKIQRRRHHRIADILGFRFIQ